MLILSLYCTALHYEFLRRSKPFDLRDLFIDLCFTSFLRRIASHIRIYLLSDLTIFLFYPVDAIFANFFSLKLLILTLSYPSIWMQNVSNSLLFLSTFSGCSFAFVVINLHCLMDNVPEFPVFMTHIYAVWGFSFYFDAFSLCPSTPPSLSFENFRAYSYLIATHSDYLD